MESLGQILVELGIDMRPMEEGLKKAPGAALHAGEAAGSAWGVGFRSPVLNALAGIGDAIQGARGSLAALGSISGSSFASEIGGYRRSLQFIAGDAKTAERAIASFMNTASSSQFDAGAVTRFGLNMAGRTGDVSGAARDTQYAVDAAQTIGVDRSHFDAFQVNLAQIQNRGDNKVETPDLQQLRDYAPMLTAAVAKSMNVSIGVASQKIAGSTGTELSKMILGLGQSNAGAAARASGSDPYAVAANTVDDFNKAMLPTGEIINAALLPLALKAQGLVQDFGRINEATGGGAGLAVTMVAGTLATRNLVGGLAETFSSAKLAAGALREVAASATGAAAKGLTGGTVSTVGAGAGAAGTGAVASVGAVVGTAAMAAMVYEAVPTAVQSVGKALKGRDDVVSQAYGEYVSSVGEFTKKGQDIGTWIPGIGVPGGTVIGSGIGAAVGAYRGAARLIHGAEENPHQSTASPTEAAQDKATKAAEELAKALDKTRFSMLGGGSRAGAEASQLEAEFMMLRVGRTGLAG